MFLLKKSIGALLDPLTIGLLILLAGVLFLWIGKKPSRGRILASIALLWLSIFSFPPVADIGLESLESEYSTPSATEVRNAQWIVVLGGGTRSDPDIPSNEQLSSPSLKRVIEAVRLAQLNPQARLIVSGGRVFSRKAEGVGMKEVAIQQGIEPNRIVVDDQSRDTQEQARNVKALVGDDSFLLVTSAWHLPRAMALFEAQGLHPIPAPADYLSDDGLDNAPEDFVPGAEAIGNIDVVFHEYIGRAWTWLRGMF